MDLGWGKAPRTKRRNPEQIQPDENLSTVKVLGRTLNNGLLILGLLIFAYFARWITWRNGKVLAHSESPFSYLKREVRVRRVPASASFWEVPLSFFPPDSPRCRFEYCVSGSALLWSAQTIQFESFENIEARIEWDPPGVASVYLNGAKAFVCDQYGNWAKPK